VDSARRTALVAGLFYLITFAAAIPCVPRKAGGFGGHHEGVPRRSWTLADSRGSTAQKYRNRPGPGWIGVDAVGR
jgi:hypothetical protein